MFRVSVCALTCLLTACACGGSRDVAQLLAPAENDAAEALALDLAVDFEPTDKLSAAIELAETEGKLVFLDFYTTWCLPCKLMDEEVFSDPAFGAYMNERFVSLKVDAEHGNGPNLAALFSVTSYPTLIFVDRRGRELTRREGSAAQRRLRHLAEEALAAGGD